MKDTNRPILCAIIRLLLTMREGLACHLHFTELAISDAKTVICTQL